jgi:hypothetical protein
MAKPLEKPAADIHRNFIDSVQRAAGIVDAVDAGRFVRQHDR